MKILLLLSFLFVLFLSACGNKPQLSEKYGDFQVSDFVKKACPHDASCDLDFDGCRRIVDKLETSINKYCNDNEKKVNQECISKYFKPLCSPIPDQDEYYACIQGNIRSDSICLKLGILAGER